MIYEITEIKQIIPELEFECDAKITVLLERAEAEILYILKKRTLPMDEENKHKKEVKLACVFFIENALKEAKTKGMKSFRQGNIAVTYDDENIQKENLEKELKKILAPLIRVQIWS